MLYRLSKSPKSIFLFVLVALLPLFVAQSVGSVGETAVSLTHNPRLYGHIYWENGLPLANVPRKPNAWVNPNAVANPDLIVQTGYYNFRLATDDVAITGFDASNGSDYLTSLHEDVTTFTPANLLLRAYKNGVAYDAQNAVIESNGLLVRLIENGQYVQRFDHMGIEFKDGNGNVLDETGYLEITAWPDRIVFTLDFSRSPDVTRTTILVVSPDNTNHLMDRLTNKINLALKPQTDETLAPQNPATTITSAYERDTNTPLTVAFDEGEYAFRLDLAPGGVSYPRDLDRVDEYVFTVNNPTGDEINVPLVFNQTNVPAITGTVMNLVEETDGRPTGIPVQISKNWHFDNSVDVNHEAYWLRGSSMITLPANTQKTLRLRVVYGYWDQVGAASHAQLSLIGWGGNWKWDESAVGAWGESATYDPSHHLGSSFIDDIRPAWTTPMNAGTPNHNWTENVGGGDFLLYFDENNKYRWGTKLKTAYRWTGPNMTDVWYSGISDDGKVRFTYKVQLLGTNDYHRRILSYRYEILDDVDPNRFVFFQTAADWYFTVHFDNFYIGDENTVDNASLIEAETAVHGGNTYHNSYLFNNRWFLIDDTSTNDGNGPSSNRVLIWRKSTLNGETMPTYLHTYGRTWGSSRTLFDVSGASVTQSYAAGDVIEGEIEFALPPESTSDYWGSDTDLVNRINSYTDVWQAGRDEMAYNNLLSPVATMGKIKSNYPLTIEPALVNGSMYAQFTIPANQGIGHIPIILQNGLPNRELRMEIYVGGQWVSVANLASNVADNAFYQGYYSSDGSIDYTFSLARPANSLNSELKVRVYEHPLPDLSSVPVTLSIALDVEVDANLSWMFVDSGDCVSDLYGGGEAYTNFGRIQDDLTNSLYDHELVNRPFYFFVEVACSGAAAKQSKTVGVFDFDVSAGD
ncbi:MAG: hypothetical protein AAF614_19265 [Chloroflexota bacterium]